MGYHVSDANSYLVITGGGIIDVLIVKKAWIWPWQKFNYISISPFDFEIKLQAMTKEKLQLLLPAVFTIGPDDNPEALRKYSMILTDKNASAKKASRVTSAGKTHVQEIVAGIIEGETRVIVSGMTMEEIFQERQVFKDQVIQHVQSELDQFGLRIYNANVRELQDTAGSEYFKFLSRKAHEGASNQAKIDVADACMKGEIGESEKKGKAKQEISKIEAETAVLETKRKAEKATANAELTTTQTKLNMDINLANIQATREAEARDAELERNVQMKRAEMELERMRATDLVSATIKKESAQQKADAALYTEQKSADGFLYKQRQDAEAKLFSEVKAADAVRLQADASFYRTKKEAEAMTEKAKAYGQLAQVMGGPQGLLQYLMLERGTYEGLAKENANAINGLQPKITVWNTGESAGSGSDGTGAIRNIMQSLPPLFSTINDQTGMMPPSWLGNMGGQGQEQSIDKYQKGKQANGV